MIQQIAAIPQKTTRLGLARKDLVDAHNLQVRVRDRGHVDTRPDTGLVSSPLTGLPFLVPVLRWIE
jgi:hypothetical protein